MIQERGDVLRSSSPIASLLLALLAAATIPERGLAQNRHKGGLSIGPAGSFPSPILSDPGPTDPLSYAMNAAANTGGDTQDGICCPPLHPPEDGPMGDASLIGAAPFDLGALLQGGLRAPVPIFDPIGIWHSELLGDVLGDRPNYGTSFAMGSYGTVGTNSDSTSWKIETSDQVSGDPDEIRAQRRNAPTEPETEHRELESQVLAMAADGLKNDGGQARGHGAGVRARVSCGSADPTGLPALAETVYPLVHAPKNSPRTAMRPPNHLLAPAQHHGLPAACVAHGARINPLAHTRDAESRKARSTSHPRESPGNPGT